MIHPVVYIHIIFHCHIYFRVQKYKTNRSCLFKFYLFYTCIKAQETTLLTNKLISQTKYACVCVCLVGEGVELHLWNNS